MSASSFEPVLLDLHEDDDYYVLTAALEDFAAHLDHQAADEQARIDAASGYEFEARSFRILAARSRRLRGIVERQLSANAEARQAALGQ